MPNKVYGIKRIAAAFNSNDPDGFLREKSRFKYLFGFDSNFLRIREEKFLTFFPEGISCYLDGQYHYNGLVTDKKPNYPQFHNLQKHVSNSK